jgi:hypothetical protein
MVAGAFDHRDGARIAHGKAFAAHAVEERFPAIAPYSTVLPTMMFSSPRARHPGWRTITRPPDRPLPT